MVGSYRIRTELCENSPELMTEIRTEKKYTKWLSYDTINHNIVFRTRRAGDYLIVNNQGGRKKIKDYLIDLKIPRAQRDQLWMLADGSHILWVVGYRISEAAKVHSETRTAIKLQMEEISNEGKS
jgi:tRNA(Ile)-lysidine synthase